MIVRQTENVEDIKTVLCEGAIYECITGDSCPSAEDFEPPTDREYTYVAGYVNGEIIGVMVYHSYNDGNECHIQVLPKYRKKHAKDFAEQAMLHRGTLPLYAEIPDLYKNVLNFALSFGFEVVGKKDGYIKHGVEYPINILKYSL